MSSSMTLALTRVEARTHALLAASCLFVAFLVVAAVRIVLGRPASMFEEAHVLTALAAALAAATPMTAEVFASDWRSGLSRHLRSAPIGCAPWLFSKLGVVAPVIALAFAFTLFGPRPSGVGAAWADLEVPTRGLLRAAAVGLAATCVAAGVLRHGLGASLVGAAVGLGAIPLIAAIESGTLIDLSGAAKRLLPWPAWITFSIAVLVGGFAAFAWEARVRTGSRRAARTFGAATASCAAALALGVSIEHGPRFTLEHLRARTHGFDHPALEVSAFAPSPDGSRVAVLLFGRGAYRHSRSIWIVPVGAEGRGEPQVVTRRDDLSRPDVMWSGDSRWLYLRGGAPEGQVAAFDTLEWKLGLASEAECRREVSSAWPEHERTEHGYVQRLGRWSLHVDRDARATRLCDEETGRDVEVSGSMHHLTGRDDWPLLVPRCWSSNDERGLERGIWRYTVYDADRETTLDTPAYATELEDLDGVRWIARGESRSSLDVLDRSGSVAFSLRGPELKGMQ